MKFPILTKEINGHEMTIHPHFEMGGRIEELSWWCHTCDPEGTATFVVEMNDYTMSEAVPIMSNYSKEHSNV